MKFIALSIALLLSSFSFASDSLIVSELQKKFPKFELKEIKKTHIEGLYEISNTNNQTIYADKSLNGFVVGELYSFSADGNVINETERKKSTVRISQIKKMKDDNIGFLFKADNEVNEIVVFTDPDCGYCRLFHQEVPKLNELGVSVRYLSFPRAGIGSASYDKLVNAYCADDRLNALTDVKAGVTLAKAHCDNTIDFEYAIGREFGVTGTPAIALADGTLLPGYRKANDINALLKDLL